MEVKQQTPIKNAIDLIYHPHPCTPIAGRTTKHALVKEGMTVREIVNASDIDKLQPIYIWLDDRLLTVAEWDSVVPKTGQMINVKASVQGGGGGGGGSNVLQMVAMIALIIIVTYFTFGTGTMTAAGMGLTAFEGAMVGAAVMVVGSYVINTVFAAQLPTMDLSGSSGGSYSQPSATYSLAGGSNRQRPYESMPILMGRHVFFPDLASKPFTEYHGEDQYMYQIFHLGLSSATYTDYKIGTNAISNYADWYWSYPDQNGKIGAFPGNVDSAVGASVKNSAGWIVRTTSANTYRIGVDIEGTFYYANNAGGMDNTSVQLRIEYRPVGTSTWLSPSSIEASGPGFATGSYQNYQVWVESGYYEYDGYSESPTWVDTSHYETRTGFFTGGGNIIIVSGSSQAPRRATLFFTPASTGQFEVRVIRDTGDSTDARLANKTNWSTLRSYQVDDSNYIGQNRIGLTIRASEQLNGVIQQLSAVGVARASYYDGANWVFGETSNPAHWFMDFALGRKDSQGNLLYGIGLSISQIDYENLAAWATFCDDEGLAFNAVLDDNKTAAEVLTAIGRCGFGSPSWASGKLGIVWDGRNQSAVAAFGMSNILRGSFNVSYITEQLAEEIIVRYINPDKDWQQDEVRVLVPGITNPARSSTIDVWGCTDTAMAGKFANYVAAQQYYRRRRITWDCDFEGFVCQRGDVVLLSHDLTQWGFSGRVVAYDGDRTITFDREVPRNGSLEYLMIKQPDGTLTTYEVNATTGNSNTALLSSAPEFQMGYEFLDHVWFFSPLSTPGKKVKILSVQPTSETRIQITATDEDAEFYASWDGAWIEPANKTLLLDSVPVISGVRMTESLYRGADLAVHSHIGVNWNIRGMWERVNIRYKVGSGNWSSFTTTSTSFEFDTTNTGTTLIEIVPLLGLKVGATFNFAGSILGVLAPVPDVEGFTDFYRAGRTVLTWRYVTDPRAISYEIRKGTTWERAEVLGTVTNNEFSALGDGTYWVAAKAGSQYSPNPAALVIEDSLITTNVIATFDEEATGWSGTLGGGAVIKGSDIVLNSTGLFSEIAVFSTIPSLYAIGAIATSGSYEIPASHIVDIGTSQACDVNISYRMASDSPYSLVSQIPVFSAIPTLVGNYAEKSNVIIQMAIAPDSGVFGDWRDFVPGSYVGRKFKFRALLYSYDPLVTPILDKFSFSVDMPDRLDIGTGVSVDAGGTSVVYAVPFQVTPNVQITINAATAGDDAILTSESETGFTIQVKNGGSGVARNINWLAQGY